MKLDLKTLEYVKQMCDLYSDSSSRTLGYSRLCELIDETKANNLDIPIVSDNEAQDWAKPDWECTKHCDCIQKEDCEGFLSVGINN